MQFRGDYLNNKDIAMIFKALGDETRLEIVSLLKDGELCACNLLENFNITQPTLSYHMKILTDSGIVIGEKNGAWMRYSINGDKLKFVKIFFENL